MNRRELLAAGLLGPAGVARAATLYELPQARLETLDKAVDKYLADQILDKSHRHYGSMRSADTLYYGATPVHLIDGYLNAYLQPKSRHYKSARVAERMELAAGAFGRLQTPDGNWNLPTTNFNSTPDTSFIMQSASVILLNARAYGMPDLEKWMLPAVRKAGHALVVGGVHTPNHRWVVCSALAGLHQLYGDPAYLRRAEQWLAEGIDQDADGQYTERSTIGYNGICNRAFMLIADWFGRPEYLDYVRRNLNASLYLMHADGEVVTEISTRQDLNQRGTLFNHWPALAYLAWKDQNRVFAGLARQFEPVYGSPSYLLRWPELSTGLPAPAPPPDNYEKVFPAIGLARIRRGPTSISLLRDRDRFFTFRHGGVVVNAVRFASAFFGRGQFRPATLKKEGASYVLTQDMEAGYYQPFSPTRKITTETYDSTRRERDRSAICKLHYQATVTETPKGCRLRIQASGTDEVPLTVEINLREGVTISGAEKLGEPRDSWVFGPGSAELSAGGATLTVGPGLDTHRYLEVRGARPRLEGPSLFLTGTTPFDHTIEFQART